MIIETAIISEEETNLGEKKEIAGKRMSMSLQLRSIKGLISSAKQIESLAEYPIMSQRQEERAGNLNKLT